MAITVGTVATGTSGTFSCTVASGETKLIVVVTGRLNGAADPGCSVSGITFNSVALTFLARKANAFATDASIVEMWYLDNPDVTTANVVVSWNASPGNPDTEAHAAYPLSGAASGAPEAHAEQSDGSASSSTINITTLTDNALVIDVWTQNRGDFAAAPGSGQTEVLDVGGSNNRGGSSYKSVATAGSTSMAQTYDDVMNEGAHGALSVAPSGGAAAKVRGLVNTGLVVGLVSGGLAR